MQIGSVTNTFIAAQTRTSGSSLPINSTDKTPEPQKEQTTRELAQSIDPTNMSRNEAREMANALFRSGDIDLSMVFFSHSAVLIPTGDGTYRNPTEADPVMNEKFNMFDAIRSNIEFKKSKNLPIENDLAALSFLEKFQVMGEIPKLDTYA